MRGKDLFYETYDALYAGKDYAGEVRAVMDIGLRGAAEGARVLEIGAGTGNHTLACARLGCSVTAVEIDPEMIAVMKRKLDDTSPDTRERVHLHEGPVETLDSGEYDMAMAMFNVVNYLQSLPAVLSFMDAVAARLREGRDFVFDAWNGVAALRDPPRDKESRTETDTHIIDVRVTSRTDFMKAETELTYELERRSKTGKRVENGIYTMRQLLWPPGVLVDAAERACMNAVGVHPLGDPAREATEDDWKILFHCRKTPKDSST